MHKFLNMYNFIFSILMCIYSFSSDEGIDSDAENTIADMLERNIVARICHRLDANDPSLTELGQVCHGE